MEISVGDGRKTAFWEDLWIGQNSLKATYPVFYSIYLQRNASISQMWNHQWRNFNFRRALNDWEIQIVAAMLQLLGAFCGIIDQVDSLRLKRNSKGIFSIKSVYWLMN